MEYSLAVTTSAGEFKARNRFVYSVHAPHIELIQQVPGTTWAAGGQHLAYWIDDIDLGATQLEEAGFLQEARPSGPRLSKSAYCADPAGVRLEIVDRVLFPDWPGFLR